MNYCPNCGETTSGEGVCPFCDEDLSQWAQLALAKYIVAYIAEEADRGNTYEPEMVFTALEAFMGGAR